MSTLDNAKELVSLIQKVGDIELYRKIVDFQGEVVSLSQTNLELERKCNHLENELRKKQSLRYERQLYFVEGDAVPYCPYCYEHSEKYIHLFGPKEGYSNGTEYYECLTCNYDYFASEGGAFKPAFRRRKQAV